MLAVIAKTTEEERKVLALAGFVHVTGLTEWGPMNGQKSVIGEYLPARWLGRYDMNNGKAVFVTSGGEVWLGYPGSRKHETGMEEVVPVICPNGQGAFVPCSNGETINTGDILARLADPDWEPQY